MRKLFLAIAMSFACATAWSQAVSTSQVSGTVQDSSGAAVPTAQVTLTQTDTGQVRSTVTASDGSYLLPNLANYSFITPTAHGHSPPPGFVASVGVYAVAYITVILAVATLVFSRRNFK